MAFLVSPTVQMPFLEIFCPVEVNTQLNKNSLTAGYSLSLLVQLHVQIVIGHYFEQT